MPEESAERRGQNGNDVHFGSISRAITGGLQWNGTKRNASLVKFHIHRARMFAMTSTAMSVEAVNGR